MKDLHMLDRYRLNVEKEMGWNGDNTCGCFRLSSPIDGQPLLIQASSEDGWDHVSVSRSNRCPNWPEMEHVKRQFFKDDETAVQFHVPPKDHINNHPVCTSSLEAPKRCNPPTPEGDGMTGDMMVLLIAVAVLLFAVGWASLVAWCAWKLGAKKDPPAGEG